MLRYPMTNVMVITICLNVLHSTTSTIGSQQMSATSVSSIDSTIAVFLDIRELVNAFATGNSYDVKYE